ncbi:DNA sulfur modification protein DndB [Priestia aryabhattai]|uniref:DNA sulfur modification protein DndB n=1 Tax=Priestia aryabhattai TaxID=412384 RepID=UPI000532EC23|nr:DNA sulfur modification protein DndB [Priestia aryabhattai]
MATLYPCMRGKFGTTEFFITTMKAGDLIKDVKSADQIPETKDLTIEEQLQRELRWDRIKSEIAPYLINDKDRFFNSLIVDIYNDTGVEFEPLASNFKANNKLYESAASPFGFLILHGGERMFALDGQHRLKALQVAITGRDNTDTLVEEGYDSSITKEDVAVIFIKHESTQKIRKIFNKINKYAKPTSKGDNIITSEDDPFAIIARTMIGSDSVFKENQVNWRSNTLSKTNKHFTTIGTLYECSEILLRKTLLSKNNVPEDIKVYYDKVSGVWENLIRKFDPFVELMNSTEINKLRESFLIGKPVGQMALIEAIQICKEHGIEDMDDLISKLNKINWSSKADIWQEVMYEKNGRIKANRTSRKLAAKLAAYMVSVEFTDEEKATLLNDYRNIKGNDQLLLPDPVH